MINFILNQSILFHPNLINDLDRFNKVRKQKKEKENKKANVNNIASELYDDLLEFYFDQYMALKEAKTKKLSSKYDPNNSFLETYL